MRKIKAFIILVAFMTNSFVPPSFAQNAVLMPVPAPVQGVVAVNPPVLKGIKVYPDKPFRFDFILDPGNTSPGNTSQVPLAKCPKAGRAVLIKDEAKRLIKYFLAALTIPEKDLWVNLSPYEHERIIPQDFSRTEMGRQTLELDYMLKQMASSLTDPGKNLGNSFWQDIYRKAFEKYGTTDIPVDTFNKVWIVPESVEIYEDEGAAFVKGLHLKVMLEEDYRALEQHAGISSVPSGQKEAQHIAADVTRDIVVPILEREVNEGPAFAALRQICYALALAVWYKGKIKQGILAQQFVDRGKTAGIRHDDPDMADKIYARYLEAVKKGAYNYVREEYDPYTHETLAHKYFSGGLTLKFMKVVTRPLMVGLLATGLYLVNVNMALANDTPVLASKDRGVERILQEMPSASAARLADFLETGAQAKTALARARALLGDQEVVLFMDKDMRTGGAVMKKLAALSSEEFKAFEALKAAHPFLYDVRYSRETFNLILDKGPGVVKAWADMLQGFAAHDWPALTSVQKMDLVVNMSRNSDLFGEKWLDRWRAEHKVVFDAISGGKASEQDLGDIRKGIMRYAAELRELKYGADGKPAGATLRAYKLFNLYTMAYLVQKGYVHYQALKGFLALTVLFQGDIVQDENVGADAITFRMGAGFAHKLLKFSSYGIVLTEQHEWGHHAYKGANFIFAEMVGDANAMAMSQMLGVGRNVPDLLQFFLNLGDKSHEQHWFARTQGLELVNFLGSVDDKMDYELLQDVFHQLLRQYHEHPETLPAALRTQLDGPQIEDGAPGKGLGYGRIGTDHLMAWIAGQYLERRGFLKEGAREALAQRTLDLTVARVIGDRIQSAPLTPEQETQIRQESNKKYAMAIAYGVKGVVPYYNGEVSTVSAPSFFRYFKGLLKGNVQDKEFVKGGIDYNPEHMKVTVSGREADFAQGMLPAGSGAFFDGLEPVVVGIMPVKDIFLALSARAG